MNIIQCLVVDDEELARTLLETYIRKVNSLHLVGKCRDPLEAMEMMKKNKVDLLFLDIQMPELTGIEFLKIMNPKPVVIFTTAYANYALEGYQLDVIDYLLKPFGFDRFLQAVNKATEWVEFKNTGRAKDALADGTNTPLKDYLLVKSEHKIHKIRYSDIFFIQAMQDYVAFHTTQGRILSLNALKSLELELPEDKFIRIHKSYIIAIEKVRTLEGNLLHVQSEKLPIGANYKEAVLKKLF